MKMRSLGLLGGLIAGVAIVASVVALSGNSIGGSASGSIGGGGGGGGSFSGGTISGETTFSAPVTSSCTALTYAATVNIDFSLTPCKTIAITGNLTLTTSNIAAGRNITIVITGDGTDRVLALPGWKFEGSQVTAIAANERVTIRLFPTSTTDATTSALMGEAPAGGQHVFFEGPTGAGVDAGSGNFFSSSGLTCGFGHQRLGTAPTDGCEVHSSKGKLTLATTLNGGTTGDMDFRTGGSSNNFNLLDSSSNVRGCFAISSSGTLIYGKGCVSGATAPGIFLVDGGASTSRYLDFTGPAHGVTEKVAEFRDDLYAGTAEYWKLYGGGVWTNPTTTGGSVQTCTCVGNAVTCDLSSPVINIVDAAQVCVVTISPTSFGSGGVNEDADFQIELVDEPTSTNKITFAGATSLMNTGCSSTGLSNLGGNVRVHYSKAVGKFVFGACTDGP